MHIYKYQLSFYALLLLFIPLLIAAQTIDTSKSSCNISDDEIYSIIKFIIKKENLNKKYGIQISALQNFTIDNNNDTNYLQTLLIKSKQTDTTEINKSDGPVLVSAIGYPYKNIFTQADIDYILCSKQNLKKFMWDNKRLSFHIKNKKDYYSFSVPYFSIDHNSAIVMWEYLCEGLCGTGKTLLLKKKNGNWNIDILRRWFH